MTRRVGTTDLLFRGATALGVAVTLITEILSLTHRLTPAWLAVSWAVVAAVAAWAVRAGGMRPAPPTSARGLPSGGAGWVVGAILAVTAVRSAS